MPPRPTTTWSPHPDDLVDAGRARIDLFCSANSVPVPALFRVNTDRWHFGACAFYRPDCDRYRKYFGVEDGLGKDGYGLGINVCVPLCATPCGDTESRNWSWPGSVTDRTPYGVLCHELGHHCDWLTGDKKGEYYSEYCERVKDAAREPGVTSYADENPAEWFAEAFRVFVTNPALLRCLRPKTFSALEGKWVPVGSVDDWRKPLGSNVPDRVIRTLKNKGAR
jgi:hypothetical protein